jgi:hypothetical protein
MLLLLPHLLEKHIKGKKSLSRLFTITCYDFCKILRDPFKQKTITIETKKINSKEREKKKSRIIIESLLTTKCTTQKIVERHHTA